MRLRIVAICVVGVAVGASILPFCAVGAALGPMMLEFGWGADQVSLSYALMMWAGALSIWPIGVLVDRYGPRPVAAAGAVAIGLVSLMLPLVRDFGQLCPLLVLLGAGGSSGLAYSRVVASLFGGRRGLAMGLFAAEGSALGLVLPIILGHLVMDIGWRGSFAAIGVVVLLAAPLIYFGLAAGKGEGDRAMGSAAAAEGMTAAQIVRGRAFWIIVAASLAAGAMGGGVLASFGAAIAEKGFGQAPVLRAAPVTLIAALAGAICAGMLLDRTRTARVAALAYLATALAYLVWALVTPSFGGEPALIGGLALGAFAFAAQFPLIGYFFSRYFGLKTFATAYGLQSFIQAVVIGLAGPAIGAAVALPGNYNLVFEVGIAVQVLAALLYLLLPSYRYPAIGEADRDDPALAPDPLVRVRSQ
ncbi:MAG TPA: MFS transporter [Caulobacteraceae bacterium]